MKKSFLSIVKWLDSFLPFAFWVLLIFGFDEYAPAIATILCAIVHEAGHVAAFNLLNKKSDRPKGRLKGFKISFKDTLSYKEDFIVSSAGPLANLIFALICVPFLKIANGYLFMLAIINLLTALTNLLPIEGYDGFRIAFSFLSHRFDSALASKVLTPISFSFICILTFLSLYLIGKIGQGYFIFFVLFISLLSKIKTLVNDDISRENERK